MHSDVYEQLIARNYDAVYAVIRDPSGDAEFYRQLALAAGGPVLELGCGTGRILLGIAREGIECVGLDASPSMLDVLREKNPPANLTIVEGRMQSFDLGAGRFALITAPFRAFSHLLTIDDQLAALACIRRHLAPGGQLVFDLFDPKLERIAAPSEPERLAATFLHSGHEIRRFDSSLRDHTTQVMTVRMRFEGGPEELSGSADFQLRWFYRFEVEHLLYRAGFSEVAIYGGFDRRPWSAFGETIVVAR